MNPERDVGLEVMLDLIYDAFLRDGAACRFSLVDLLRVSLVGGEVTHDCVGGGFRAYSCSSRPVHKV